jgi:hypothetical protein
MPKMIALIARMFLVPGNNRNLIILPLYMNEVHHILRDTKSNGKIQLDIDPVANDVLDIYEFPTLSVFSTAQSVNLATLS